jgi:hypothetical protein
MDGAIWMATIIEPTILKGKLYRPKPVSKIDYNKPSKTFLVLFWSK